LPEAHREVATCWHRGAAGPKERRIDDYFRAIITAMGELVALLEA